MNTENITSRVAIRFAKAKPETILEAETFDMRENLKSVKQKLAEQMLARVQGRIKANIKGLVSVDIKLGKFRGSHFITSCKLEVRCGKPEAKRIEGILRDKWSPKFNLKDWVDGVAFFNIR